MSSNESVLLGAREPRVRVRPDGATDFRDGADAVALAAGYGLVADPWQADVVEGWLARDGAGRLAAGRVSLVCPRQSGKNGVLEIVQLFKLVFEGRRILMTAHEVKTVRKAFLRLLEFFENPKNPDLMRLVKQTRKTNGLEAIHLHNGGVIEFVARTRSSGRGFSVDDLMIDEAQELTDEQLEALLPTVSAAADPQLIFAGTPPTVHSKGTVFGRVRKDALEGGDRIVWDEWGIDTDVTAKDVAERFEELVAQANPALGIRLQMKTIRSEYAAMSAEGFMTERLGQWRQVDTESAVFKQEQWAALRAGRPSDGVLSLGVRFTADGSGVALAAAVKHDKGVYVEPIRQANMGEGVQWLVEAIMKRVDRAAQVVVDGKAGAGALAEALRQAGLKNRRIIILPTVEQVQAAHSMFEQAVNGGTITHPGWPEFDEQVLTAKRRRIGPDGGFGWESSEQGTVVTLDAATFAHWGAVVTRRRPGQKVRVSA